MKTTSLYSIANMTEEEARAEFEHIRWPNGPVCPHCESDNVIRIPENAAKKVRPGLLQCRDCRKQFTVTSDTVMHRTRVPLKKWLMAFHLIASSKKGISALQLQRNLGLSSYQTAWHMAHRIRFAMQSDGGMLSGTVEVDETYVGGKPRKGDPRPSKRGRGTRKTPVVALVQRDGNVKSKVVANVTGATLKGAIREHVSKDSRIVTDELGCYNGIGDEFDGGHERVKHGAGEYVRGDVYTNTAECYFSILKRGVFGVYHRLSKKHLHRYCTEFDFRWNHRKMKDGERMEAMIARIGGKRLSYKPTKAMMANGS